MKYLDNILNISIAVGVILIVVMACVYIQDIYFGEESQDERIHLIYDKLWTETGQGDEKLPLVISDRTEVNAFNDGHRIVLFRGLIDKSANYDEIALVLGHEIAHSTLRHIYYSDFLVNKDTISTAENNADKMGAVYMMKAGYDVCKARERYVRWRDTVGNQINGDHPTYSMRYDELNIGCE